MSHSCPECGQDCNCAGEESDYTVNGQRLNGCTHCTEKQAAEEIMETEIVTIILPLPPSCLSPNRPPGSFGGRMRKAVAAKRYRKAACTVAKAEEIESGPWQKAEVSATFFHKQDRRRDDVNHLAMLKPAYDGVVDSGLLVDDDSEHLTTLCAVFKIDKEWPRVEIRFERTV